MRKAKEKDIEAVVQRMLEEQQKRNEELSIGKDKEVCHNRAMDLLKIKDAIKEMQNQLDESLEHIAKMQSIIAKSTEAHAKIDFNLKMIEREIENNEE